jgi:hypothetical protein
MATVAKAAENCAICLSALLEGEQKHTLFCTESEACHVFHWECIKKWEQISIKEDGSVMCPLCRTDYIPSPHDEDWETPANEDPEPSFTLDTREADSQHYDNM